MVSAGASVQNDQSALSGRKRFGSLATYKKHSEGIDQTGQMLILVFAEFTGHFVGFVVLRLILQKHYIWATAGRCDKTSQKQACSATEAG